MCAVSIEYSGGGGGGGPSPTVTDRLSQVSRNCSQAPSVGIRSLVLPVWGGDISHSRTDNRQHSSVVQQTTRQITKYKYPATAAKFKILSISTTIMLRIFSYKSLDKSQACGAAKRGIKNISRQYFV